MKRQLIVMLALSFAPPSHAETISKAMVRPDMSKPLPTLTITSGTKCIDPPVACRVSSRFGYRLHPTEHVWKLHRGMDFACPTGTEIKAAFDGVAASGYQTCGGNLASLSAGNVVLKQWHQSTVFVPSRPDNKTVRKGELISLSGNTGSCTTGPHLHFEYWVGDNAENPLAHYCSGASQDPGEGSGTPPPAPPSQAGGGSGGNSSGTQPSAPTGTTGDGGHAEDAHFQDDPEIDIDNASITEQLLMASESRFANPRWYGFLLSLSSDEGLLREIAYLRAMHGWAGYQQLQMRERILVGLADLQQLKTKRNEMKKRETNKLKNPR